MATKRSRADKIAFDEKFRLYLGEYNRILIVGADNVGSKQLQVIRQALRGGDCAFLMGKNSMMRRSIRVHAEMSGNTRILGLIPLLVGNVGLVFTKGDLIQASDIIREYKVGAPARVGVVAPTNVVVPAGNTGLDPTSTSFFQALYIPTRISKGTVEITCPVEVLRKGQKVGSSEAVLLSKLGIKPFSYGLVVLALYENGSVFTSPQMHLTEDQLIEKFSVGCKNVVALDIACRNVIAPVAAGILLLSLPDEIKQTIFSLVDTQDAVHWSLFSKCPSRKEFWKSLETLNFDESRWEISSMRFKRFVNKVFKKRYRCGIKILRMNLTSFEIRDFDLRGWLVSAAEENVQEIYISGGLYFYSNFDLTYVAPCHKSLKVFHLELPEFENHVKLPTEFSFPCLREVKFVGVTFYQELVNAIFGLPALEALMLDECNFYSRLGDCVLAISSTVIRHISITTPYNPTTIRINAPNLISLNLEGDITLQEASVVPEHLR
ncbi:hypothetical protein MKW92_007640 [Papaver armeniacum]|nr:hypothetical protein MKW92_007640 [Papaver armeniacum]